MNIEIIKKKFEELFGQAEFLVRSPGRVNLIGEHTDYNGGFVLPASIDKDMVLAVSKNGTNQCHIHSVNFDESVAFEICDTYKESDKSWANYILGVLEQVQERGESLEGFNCVFGGDIPVGSGLSSSAALECGLGFAINQLFGLGMDRLDIVKSAQMAENEFVGVKCGIMDQFANTFGKSGHVIKLDCRSLEYEYYPFNMAGYKILLFDTQVKHSLASSEYNTRRKECEAGVALMATEFPVIESLRDCSLDMLASFKKRMEPKVYNRCKYVIEENQRVENSCTDLENDNLQAFGEKMYASHAGLKDLYEVSCHELDVLVDITKPVEGVLGARMMGGGFGGCTINLVKEEEIEALIKQVQKEYATIVGKEIGVYNTVISNGTSIIENTHAI